MGCNNYLIILSSVIILKISLLYLIYDFLNQGAGETMLDFIFKISILFRYFNILHFRIEVHLYPNKYAYKHMEEYMKPENNFKCA